jgi:2-dehydropantoate 2-reductase
MWMAGVFSSDPRRTEPSGRRAAGTVRICVAGCGAIGSLFAAHLGTVPDSEVWAYDIAEEHVRVINSAGLTVTGTGAPVVSRVRAVTDGSQIPPCQFAIVATKSLGTGAALAAVVPALADAAVCSVQNGIGNEELIAARLPRVIRGVTMIAGHLTAPGVVNLDAPGSTWLGPFEPRPARMDEVRRLAGLLNRSGLAASALPDSRPPQWTKLIFNAATSPVTALTGLTVGQLRGPVRELVDGLVAEGQAVADALGVTLDGDVLAMIDEARVIAAGHRTSMLQDVLARRATEVAVLNGGIVRAGQEAGIATPLHQAMSDLIDGLERSWAAP